MSSAEYVELRSHSWYSFLNGASSVGELPARTAELELPALGMTDVNNLCGALEFARAATVLGIQPISGADLLLDEGSDPASVSLLAESGTGYANLSRLLSLARLVDWSGPEGVGRVRGHAASLSGLVQRRLGVPGAATAPGAGRHRAHPTPRRAGGALRSGGGGHQRSLVSPAGASPAARRAHRHPTQSGAIRSAAVAQNQPPVLAEVEGKLRALFRSTPEALRNSLAIAERCSDFNLSDYMADRYRFPDCPVPDGHDAQSWFEELCRQAARRRYDRIDRRVRDRLDEEFALIRHHGLAGFFLIYHRVVQLAREVMLELGHGNSEMPLEWPPPGRGRGSSVVMLTGYLIGLSHVDPLAYDLSLDRFLPEGS